MKRYFPWIIAAFFCPTLVAAATEDEVLGVWLTEDQHGLVLFEHCGTSICGKLAGMDPSLAGDGTALRDNLNPDSTARNQLLCGLAILHILWNAERHNWEGSIYDPASGKTYSSAVSILPTGALRLRGYITHFPIFGRTETWSRYRGSLYSDCRMHG